MTRADIYNDVSFTIGTDSYTNGEKTIELRTAPEISQDRTFVPLRFFQQVIGTNNADVIDGQIIVNFIDNTIAWAKPSVDFVTEREIFHGIGMGGKMKTV